MDAAITGGLIAVALILAEVVKSLVNKRKNGRYNNGMAKMAKQIDDLYDWHNKDAPDNPGVKVWYVQHTLVQAIEKLGQGIDAQVLMSREMINELKDMRRDVTELSRKVESSGE